MSPIIDGLNESKTNQTSNEIQSANETSVSQSSPIASETISPSSPLHSVGTEDQS